MRRAMWSGAISFGLVNIPVKMFKTTSGQHGDGVSFHQIHKKCGTRLKHIRWCPKDEVEVPWSEVAKGYEVQKGRYVLLDEEELDELLPDEDHAAVAIESFVALSEVDPIYYDRAYYLAPDGAPKPYRLLHRTMAATERVAVARVMLRTRSHLALVRTYQDHLLLETLHYPANLIPASEFPGAGRQAVDRREEAMAERLVESLTVKWDPDRYQDVYTSQVKKLIETKAKGGEVTGAPADLATSGGKVIDLMEALKRSLESPQSTRGAEPAKPGARSRRGGSARPTVRTGRRQGAHPSRRRTAHRRHAG